MAHIKYAQLKPVPRQYPLAPFRSLESITKLATAELV